MGRARQGLIDCGEDLRRPLLAGAATPLNGIDFVEYSRTSTARRLTVTFLKDRPATPPLTASHFSIEGGIRVTGIEVLSLLAPAGAPRAIVLLLSAEGDFSTYVLRLRHPQVDAHLSEASFGFKASCPSPFDCRESCDCGRLAAEEPALDYLARDYQSFRRMLFDFAAERNPNWTETLPADLGTTLLELVAYAGDQLAYFQDAAATEAYLDTALHRISVRRHARLIDYRMHDGANARGFVQFDAAAGGVLAAGTRLTTRIGAALLGASAPPGPVLPLATDFRHDPALAQVTVFETAAALTLQPDHNALRIHTWGNADCCLGAGTTEVSVYHLRQGGTARRPAFAAGDWLLIEEVASPKSGRAADADATHRWVVRLSEVADTRDEVFTDTLGGATLTPRLDPANEPALPLQRLRWNSSDALPQAVQVSARGADLLPIDPVTIVRGNVVPADHGLTIHLDSERGEIGMPTAPRNRHPVAALPVPLGPLTMSGGSRGEERRPALALALTVDGEDEESWEAVPDLLDSTPYDRHFVAEVDDDGAPQLRFGDGQYGKSPQDAQRARLSLRVGNGRSGNLGAAALVHAAAQPGLVNFVYQPLAATGGSDPQSAAEVQKLAPQAFRSQQFRAVTETDWREVARRHPDVLDARAIYRWTGSWHTAFVAVQPRDDRQLVPTSGGGFTLAPDYASDMLRHLRGFKLAGQDLCVLGAAYVPLELEIRLCIERGYVAGDVMGAVRDALSAKAGGFFDQATAGFGRPVYLSRIYAAIDGVEGLESASIEVFKRYWERQGDALERGVIDIGPFEIARLDNVLSAPEFGVLRLTVAGEV